MVRSSDCAAETKGPLHLDGAVELAAIVETAGIFNTGITDRPPIATGEANW